MNLVLQSEVKMESFSNSDSKSSRFLNPWVLNFQKLGLELKCPLCLCLLNRPVLLPCNHVFCRSCVPGSADCSICKAKFVDQDLRHLPFLENMAAIYKCLDATFSTNLIQPAHSGAERISLPSPASTNIRFEETSKNDFLENGMGSNSCSRQPISKIVGVDQKDNVETGRMSVDVRARKFNGTVSPNLTSPPCRAYVEMGVKAGAQSAPGSPPSFGDAKGSDNDSCFQCSEHSSENSILKRASRENGKSRIGKLRDDRSGLDNDVNFREVKRHKQLNYKLGQLNSSSADQDKVEEVSGLLMPNSDLKLQKVSPPVSMQATKISDPLANTMVCAFCHSSKISEESGVMLHYLNEKLVEGHEAAHSSVIHVHKVCIDWAPRVFYVDDKAKNLKIEVARGAKLKCSKCGQKGSALGCYVKSCRKSYHVRCAMKIAKCRWDLPNYLMLCPDHSSTSFPNENSRPEKNISKDLVMPAMVSCQLSNRTVLPDNEKTWVLCGSALSVEEKILMVKFGKMNSAVVSKFWNPGVTHVIAATDEEGACIRTLKVLMAILNGRWVVKVDWIKACIEAKCHVDEEPFEVGLDNYGCRDSPKNGRLRAANNEPKLFSGLSFYFVGDFVPTYLEDLQELVIAAGGILITSKEEMLAQKNAEPALVVYNIDPPEGSKLGQEVSILWKRMSKAEDVALQTGSKVIGHTWLLESIAGYKLQTIC